MTTVSISSKVCVWQRPSSLCLVFAGKCQAIRRSKCAFVSQPNQLRLVHYFWKLFWKQFRRRFVWPQSQFKRRHSSATSGSIAPRQIKVKFPVTKENSLHPCQTSHIDPPFKLPPPVLHSSPQTFVKPRESSLDSPSLVPRCIFQK